MNPPCTRYSWMVRGGRALWVDYAAVGAILLAVLMQSTIVAGTSYGNDLVIYSAPNFQGVPHYMRIGDTWDWHSPGGDACFSFRILNDQAAIRCDRRVHDYPELFFYSEVDQPFVAGTDQYCDQPLRISCVTRELPQPAVFVPIDAGSVHPTVVADQPRGEFLTFRANTLALRRAFFWENSEDTGGAHGPYAELHVNIVSPAVVQCYLDTEAGVAVPPCEEFSYENLVNDPNLWFRPTRTFHWWWIPGPIYHETFVLTPNPHNEWIDSHWGAVYSNVGILDWDEALAEGWADVEDGVPQIGIVVSEADGTNPQDFLGAGIVRQSDSLTVILLRMFGWISLETVTAGPEAPFTDNTVYVWNDWDGFYPEPVCSYRPPPSECCCPEPCGTPNGSAYLPYADWNQAYSCTPAGETIGLLPGAYPGGVTLSKPMILRPVYGTSRFGN